MRCENWITFERPDGRVAVQCGLHGWHDGECMLAGENPFNRFGRGLGEVARVELESRVLKYEHALKQIAEQDYRGNACVCRGMARQALDDPLMVTIR